MHTKAFITPSTVLVHHMPVPIPLRAVPHSACTAPMLHRNQPQTHPPLRTPHEKGPMRNCPPFFLGGWVCVVLWSPHLHSARSPCARPRWRIGPRGGGLVCVGGGGGGLLGTPQKWYGPFRRNTSKKKKRPVKCLRMACAGGP